MSLNILVKQRVFKNSDIFKWDFPAILTGIISYKQLFSLSRKYFVYFSFLFNFIQSSPFLGEESWGQSIFHWKSRSIKKINDCTQSPQRTQNGSLYAELKINIVNVSRINDHVLPGRSQSKNISTSKHYLKQISSLTISLFIWSSKRFLTWRENLERCRHFIGDIQHV